MVELDEETTRQNATLFQANIGAMSADEVQDF